MVAAAFFLAAPLRAPLRRLPVIAVPGLLLFAGTLAYSAATREGDLSVVAVCSSLFPVVTVGLAYLGGERVSRLQAVGIGAALGGNRARERRRDVGSRHARADEVPPGRGRHPDALGEPAPRPARRPAAAAEPGDRRARRARRPDADLPDGADRAGGLDGAARSRSPTRCARRTGCGGRRRCTARVGSRRRSAPRRTSTTSTRASRPPAPTSPTPPSRRRSRTPAPASRSSSTETGAGQWGSSLAFACSLFGLECEVYMVGSSYDQKPYRRSMMQTWGATVHRSPSDRTESGRGQASHPTGSLGIAISEAVEVAAQDPDCNYSLGSVLNHVLLHQTVIGQEAILQMEQAGEQPDVIVGCVGGGSNFAGLVFPFLRAGTGARIVAAEPAACPTLTRGALRLRLRRHRRADAADADVHARARLRPAARARRRPALPRRRADAVRARQGRRDRGARLPAERHVRRRRPVRAHRGDHPGARAGPRDPRGDRGGRGGEARPARSA